MGSLLEPSWFVIFFIFITIIFYFTNFSGHSKACPERMCTNGTQVPCEVPSLPNPTTRKGWPHHRGLRPLLFSNSGVGSFTSHKNQISVSAVRRDLRFSVLIQDADADVITKAALSPQLFKDPECWSGQGLNPRPPARQTGALPTELTRHDFVSP